MKNLLEDLRHELTTLHGLRVTDDLTHEVAWELDESSLLERIDDALAVEGGASLYERIEEAYDRAIRERGSMLADLGTMRRIEERVKVEHKDEWAGAKNNDVRATLLAGWLADEDYDYAAYRDCYEKARDEYRLALLEIERLRLLVEAAKAEGGRS